jgi:hypothetical protein
MLLTFIFCYHNYQPDLWYINASRILQLAELFKLQSYQRAVKVISNTLLQTYKTFFFLYWFVMLLVVVFGAIMFALERGELTVNEDYPDGEYLRWNIERTEKEVSPFRSLAASMWYTLVSITTVGYGDIVPTTVAGRAVGSFLLLISFLIVALPITVIGEAFANAVDEYNNDKVRSRTVINTTSSSSNGNNTSFRPNFDRPTLHSLESMLRDSAGSIEENKNETDNNIATNATTSTSYNPIRRSLLRPLNRASTRAMNAILQEIQNQQQTEEQKTAELEQEKQQEIIDQWVDCLEKTTTSSNSSLRELLELQFELYQNNQKMKEIESEYLKQLKSFHEIQAVLFEKIQILMMTLNQKDQQSNQLKTNANGEVSGGGARGEEGKEVEQVTNDKPVEVVSAKNEITTFEIQL